MLPLHASQFVCDTSDSFIYGLASGLPPWYKLHFIQPHKKESNGFKLGEQEGQATGPPLPFIIFIQKFCYHSAEMQRFSVML
jgi:hypothetical protein